MDEKTFFELQKLKHFGLLYLLGLQVNLDETAHEDTSYNSIEEKFGKYTVTRISCSEWALKTSTHISIHVLLVW